MTLGRREPRLRGTRPPYLRVRPHLWAPGWTLPGGGCPETVARIRLPGRHCCFRGRKLTPAPEAGKRDRWANGRGPGWASGLGPAVLCTRPATRDPAGPLGTLPRSGKETRARKAGKGRPGRPSPLQGGPMRPGPRRKEPPGRAGKGAPPASRGDPRPRRQPTRSREAPARRTMSAPPQRPAGRPFGDAGWRVADVSPFAWAFSPGARGPPVHHAGVLLPAGLFT